MPLTDHKTNNAVETGADLGTKHNSLIDDLFDFVYPVGIVITLGVSTNPATLLGGGTWAAIAGKVIVGIDATQTEFDTLDETGGAKTHTLQISEIPAHTHSEEGSTLPGDVSGAGGSGSGWGHFDLSGTTGSAGGGGAHNNLQPYIVKYVWQRTA